MTSFEKFRIFLNSFEIDDSITRKEIMSKEFGLNVSIDNYRNWFTKAGYLKWISPGKYQLVKYPKYLTSRDLRKEAYPHYKNWYEYRHLNKV